jgi:hypothetical protein
MAEAVYYLEILFGLAALVIAFRASVLLFEIHEVEDEMAKERAKREYQKALSYYKKHPSDLKAKKACYEKGDIYYRFKIPDFFSYPLPDFDTHVEYLDHAKAREDLITKDLSERMESLKKAA